MRQTIDSFRGEQFTLLGQVVRGEALATADVAAGAAVIPVDSTAGYPASGSAIVGGAVVTYTGVTAASLTGCVGTPTIQAGTVVPYAVDLRLAGTVLEFVAKRTRTGSVVVDKENGGAGITIPSTAPGHVYNISILSGDTAAFTATEELIWELRLTEPGGGDVTVVGNGDWRVALGAS